MRSKVDLYERIRRDQARHPEWGIRRLAGEHCCHRRDVRLALTSATPAPRKRRNYRRPVLEPWLPTIDAWLRLDQKAPRKQRHTAHRIWTRLTEEHGATVAERTVREYVSGRRREIAPRSEVMVPQHHEPGQEAEVDFGESDVIFPEGRQRVFLFEIRACASGAPFRFPVRALVQQALLEAFTEAFGYFGGVFERVRMDNLTLAVRRILRGRQRLETEAFVRLRSHYLFNSEYCLPGIQGAHEKGGVEGEVGYGRRNWFVPVPELANWQALIDLCRHSSEQELRRTLAGRTTTVGEDWERERALLRPLPAEPFDSRRHVTARVDPKSRAAVLRNRYSVPVALAERQVAAAVSSTEVVLSHGGHEVARHERLYGIGGDRLELDHYLEVLRFKPRALAGCVPLRQAEARGTFSPAYRQLFDGMRQRLGESEGARQMVDVLFLHREYGAPTLLIAVEAAVAEGTFSHAAVALRLRALTEPPVPVTAPQLHVLHEPEVPVPTVHHYDQLLGRRV